MVLHKTNLKSVVASILGIVILLVLADARTLQARSPVVAERFDASRSRASVAAVCSNPIAVTSPVDSGAGSLRQALLDICSGGLITFDNGLSGSTIALSSELDIAIDVTISGTVPITVSGSNSVRVFDVQPNRQVTFDSLTIANGNSPSSGGGIYNNYGTVTVTNSTLSGNAATSDGGGIQNDGGTVAVSNSTLSGNSAYWGGGIFNDVQGVVTVSNSTLSGNSAAVGGGISVDSGTVTVSNSIIANSTSGGDCLGSITSAGYNLDSDNSCGLSATGDITNTAPLLMPLGNYGGPTLTHLPIFGSPVVDAGDPAFVPPPDTDQRGEPREFFGRLDIGAVEAKCGNAISVLNNNDAGVGSLRQAIVRVCPGGLITFDNGLSGSTIPLGSELDIDTDVTISGTVPITISGSSSVRVFDVLVSRNVTLASLTIANGNVGDAGGGIRNSGTLTLTSSTVISNSANGGGGIHNLGTLFIDQSTIANNQQGNGGGILNDSSLTVTNSTFRMNSGSAGGGIHNSATGTLSVTNSTFSANSVTFAGGGVYNAGTISTIANSTLFGNSAGSYGGGVYDIGTITSIANTIIAGSPSGGNCTGAAPSGSHNISDSSGCWGWTSSLAPATHLGPLADNGGKTQTIALLETAVPNPAIDGGDPAFTPPPQTDQRGEPRVLGLLDIGAVEKCGNTISVLNAGDAGAGSLRQALLDVCVGGLITFDNSLSGSTIALSSGLNIDTDVTISGTVPITVSGSSSVRVFFVQANRQVTFNSLTIANGNTGGYGGGIMVTAGATVTVSNSTLSGSTATSGGGGIYMVGGRTVLQNSTVSTNAADGVRAATGGGIQAQGGQLVLNNSTVDANVAEFSGGGIHSFDTDVTITDSTISNNRTRGTPSSSGGAGIYGDGNTVMRLSNSTISGNTTSAIGQHGGGIYLSQGGLTINSSTIATNTAATTGGGIYALVPFTSTNNIIGANFGSDCDGVFAYVSYTLIEDSALDACKLTVSSVFNGNKVGYPPLLGPLANNSGPTKSHALLAGSPAIDAIPNDVAAAGIAAANMVCGGTVPDTDQRGVSRPVGAGCDMGSIEVDVPLAVTLGWFRAEDNGDAISFHWTTVTETGTAGFNLLGVTDQGKVQLNDALIPSLVIDSVTPTDYSATYATNTTHFYLQEVGIDGGVTDFGPFALGDEHGANAQPDNVELTPRLWLPIIQR